MTDFAPGAVIDGRYRVRSRVGAGGMADVYLAQDEQLGRQVAVKVLHRRFAADPGFVERFKREAQSAAVLQHRHVVSVFDRGSFDGTYYIAMEYLPGRSLKALIQEEAPLDPKRAIDITIQILQATGFAHRHGVIHRDLKPHNVIIDSEDNVKVTDFGIARAGASDMTETGSIMGTAQYLSPEQAQGHAVSGPSDLYSVGVVLYEMLTGTVPFDGESPVSIALKHVSETPTPPSQLNHAVSPQLEQVVLWALNKNPADRPADADQFIEALQQVKDNTIDHTASMQALTALAGAGTATAATRSLPGGGGSGATGAGQSYDLDDSGQRDQSKLDEDARAKRRRRRWLIIAGLVALLAIAGIIYTATRPAKAEVPSVVGMSLQNAESTLESAGFASFGSTTQANSATANTVIGQDPLARQKVKTSTRITLIVSSGPATSATVNVPQVVSLTRAQAIAAISKSGLTVQSTPTESSTTVAKGEATRTDPAAGTPLGRGAGVTIYISSGPPTQTTTTSTTDGEVRVPNLITNSLATAQSTLSNLNLGSTVTFVTSSTEVAGTVLGQNPSAGTKVAQGTTVTLTVAQAADEVPNVVGITAAEAVSTLRAAGYQSRLTYGHVSASTQNGIVQKQTPAANSTAAANSIVTLLIGVYVGTSTNAGTTTTNAAASAAGPTTSPANLRFPGRSLSLTVESLGGP